MTVRKTLATLSAAFLALAVTAGSSFGQSAPAQGANPAAPAQGTKQAGAAGQAGQAGKAGQAGQAPAKAPSEKTIQLKKEMSELVFKIKKYNNSMVEYIERKGPLPPAMQGDLSNMAKDTSAALKRLDQIMADPAIGPVMNKQDVEKFKNFKKQAEKTVKDAQQRIAGK